MTTKKLNVKIYKTGSENDVITRSVANYNEGIIEFSPRDLEGYLQTRNAIYPTVSNYKLIKDESEPNTYHISEDGGKTFTLSIEWVEIHTIEPKIPTFEEIEEDRKYFEKHPEETNDDLKNIFN